MVANVAANLWAAFSAFTAQIKAVSIEKRTQREAAEQKLESIADEKKRLQELVTQLQNNSTVILEQDDEEVQAEVARQLNQTQELYAAVVTEETSASQTKEAAKSLEKDTNDRFEAAKELVMASKTKNDSFAASTKAQDKAKEKLDKMIDAMNLAKKTMGELDPSVERQFDHEMRALQSASSPPPPPYEVLGESNQDSEKEAWMRKSSLLGTAPVETAAQEQEDAEAMARAALGLNWD